VHRTLTHDEVCRIFDIEGLHTTQYTPGGVVPDDAYEVRVSVRSSLLLSKSGSLVTSAAWSTRPDREPIPMSLGAWIGLRACQLTDR
jgi:hypothetical protein